jgi:hypothetical protein
LVMPMMGMDQSLLQAPMMLGPNATFSPPDQQGLEFVGQTIAPIIQSQIEQAVGDPPDHPKPKAKEILEHKERLVRYWQPRNKRFQEDQEMYELAAAESESDEVGVGEAIALNDPYVIIEKVANMVGSQEPSISVPCRDAASKEFAQKTEDALYWIRQTWAQRHEETLHGPLSREEAHYASLRGWICGRVTWNPNDPKFPWEYTLVDPVNVYPQIGSRGIEFVIHTYKATIGDLRADYGGDKDMLRKINNATYKGKSKKEVKYDDEVEVVAYADKWYHGLIVNDIEVKIESHNYGFLPWEIRIPSGSPIRQTPWDKSKYVSRIGPSIFEGIKSTYSNLNRLVSMIVTEVSKVPNPPSAIFTDAEGVLRQKTLDTSPGATNYFIADREKYQIVETSRGAMEMVQPVLGIYTDRMNRGSLPPMLYGEGAQTLSGFAVSLLSAGARDVVFPLVRCLEGYRAAIQQKALKLYEMLGETLPAPVEMIATQKEGAQAGVRQSNIVFKPEYITASGSYNEVTYRSLAPQDRAAMANIAAMLVREQIIDRETARGDEFLGLQNPGLIDQKVLAEMIYQNKDVVQLMVPMALQKTDPTGYLTYLYATQQKTAGAMSQAASQMSPNAMPNGIVPNMTQMFPEAMTGASMGQMPVPPGAVDMSGAIQAPDAVSYAPQ